MKKWTILIVNYKSSIYLKWQLKILYDFNNPHDFDFIIIDNSRDEEERLELNNLTNDYIKKFNNIKLFFYEPVSADASGQHGEAIEFAKQYINSELLLIHDPDFFWLKKNYLTTLANLLQIFDAVGAPYPHIISQGHHKFPSAFGCSYRFDKVKNISFKPYIDGDFDKSWQEFHKFTNQQKELVTSGVKQKKKMYDFCYDVGWLVRKNLSRDDDNNFVSFKQINIKNGLLDLLQLKDSYSFETNTGLYFWNDEIIALHLFRGTFTGTVVNNKDPNQKLMQKTLLVRDKIGELMYNQIANNSNDLSYFYNEFLKNKKLKKLLRKIIKSLNPFKKS